MPGSSGAIVTSYRACFPDTGEEWGRHFTVRGHGPRQAHRLR